MEWEIQLAGQLAHHLKSLRQAKGLTQAQLGELLGLKQNRVAAIEKDPTRISVKQLFALLQALDVKVLLRPRQKPAPRSTEW